MVNWIGIKKIKPKITGELSPRIFEEKFEKKNFREIFEREVYKNINRTKTQNLTFSTFR